MHECYLFEKLIFNVSVKRDCNKKVNSLEREVGCFDLDYRSANTNTNKRPFNMEYTCCCCTCKYNITTFVCTTSNLFLVLFYYSLVGMRVILSASFVLILSYVSDRRELVKQT